MGVVNFCQGNYDIFVGGKRKRAPLGSHSPKAEETIKKIRRGTNQIELPPFWANQTVGSTKKEQEKAEEKMESRRMGRRE